MPIVPGFRSTIAGSLPKPDWLAESKKLWPAWKQEGEALEIAKQDATLLWLKQQEDAGLDIVTDGEQSRQHFVHGFLEFVEGIDFSKKVKMGIRNNRYDAMVPTVTGPLRLKGRVHQTEARLLRAHTSHQIKFTLPGPLTIIDTLADGYYGDRVKMAFAFAELLNQEARGLQEDGIDIIQFDEPAFNVYPKEATEWGIKALDRAMDGITCTTAVHICYGNRYGKPSWEGSYRYLFPKILDAKVQQLTLEFARRGVEDLDLFREFNAPFELGFGVIDVKDHAVETPDIVAERIRKALKVLPPEKLFILPDCGLFHLPRDIAFAKLRSMVEGARTVRGELGAK